MALNVEEGAPLCGRKTQLCNEQHVGEDTRATTMQTPQPEHAVHVDCVVATGTYDCREEELSPSPTPCCRPTSTSSSCCTQELGKSTDKPAVEGVSRFGDDEGEETDAAESEKDEKGRGGVGIGSSSGGGGSSVSLVDVTFDPPLSLITSDGGAKLAQHDVRTTPCVCQVSLYLFTGFRLLCGLLAFLCRCWWYVAPSKPYPRYRLE